MLGVIFRKPHSAVSRRGSVISKVWLGCRYVDSPSQEGGALSQCADCEWIWNLAQRSQ